jgi:hypothetical protein
MFPFFCFVTYLFYHVIKSNHFKTQEKLIDKTKQTHNNQNILPPVRNRTPMQSLTKHWQIAAPWSPDQKSREQAIKTMHANSVHLDPNIIRKTEKSTKEHYAQNDCDVSITSWALTNFAMNHKPKTPLIKVLLQELFPVLEGATVCEDTPMKSFIPPNSTISQMHIPIDTVSHGHVMLTCAGIAEGCRMEIRQMEMEGHAAVCHCLHVYPDTKSGISYCGINISLIHQLSNCQACGKHNSRDAKLRRCSRCWKTLRAPVWYCDARCQAADYPSHRHQCGKVPSF